MAKIYYEVERFDDGSFQIASGEKAKEIYEDDYKGDKRVKKFIEVRNNKSDIYVLEQGKTSDELYDKDINLIRQTLYDFMCKRRELFGVNEHKLGED